jgi:hypothetical protein
MKLTSFSPKSGYPNFDLYRYAYLTRAVHNGVHTLNHRLLQPNLCVRRLLCVALDDHFIVADENRDGSWHSSLRSHRRVCISPNALT